MNSKWDEFMQGDNEALAYLYSELFQPLLFVSLKHTNDPEASKDLVADLFLFLIETSTQDRLTKWKEVREIQSFLKVIIRNKSIDFARRKANHSILENKWAKNQTKFYENTFLDTEYFEKCISSLNEQEKSIFTLHLAGYNNQEIALKFDYSEKTIRNKLSLSRKKIIYIWKNLLILMLWKILN